MAERTVELDEPTMEQSAEQQSEALERAVDRADRAEAELARLKGQASSQTSAQTRSKQPADPGGDQRAQAVAPRGTSSTARPDTTGDHLVEPGSMDASKQPAAQSPEGHVAGDPQTRGVAALRDDKMMAHLLDALDQGQDIGHYGRLVFAMIGRHFMSDDELLAELTKDKDFSEEEARQMLVQVEGRDYSPPRRERILEWQAEQEFAIIPDKSDPDCGNVYKTLRFPKETYDHIGHYQEEKAQS